MTTILHIDASPRTAFSGSRMLSRELVDAYTAASPSSQVRYRDLAAAPPSLVDEPWIAATYTPPDQRTAEMQATLQESDVLIDELMAADLIVIGVPMHNFGIGTLLKCYIDQVVRVGRTFQFTPAGPQGLVPNKRVVIITTRGSDYSASHMTACDFQEPYLRTVLGFLGITDVTFITCNGMDAGNRDRAMAEARQTIRQLTAGTLPMPAEELKAVAVYA